MRVYKICHAFAIFFVVVIPLYTQVPTLFPLSSASLPFESSALRDVEVVGDHIYIAKVLWSADLYTLEIATDHAITRIDSQPFHEAWWSQNMLSWSGEYLYVVNHGISAYEISDEGIPQRIDHGDTTLSFQGIPSIYATYNEYVYVHYWDVTTLGYDQYLTAIDFSDPLAPFNSYGIAFTPGNQIVVQDEWSPFLVSCKAPYVFDISNPAQPQAVYQVFSDTLVGIVPFGNSFVSTREGTPSRERVLQLSQSGELSYKDGGNRPDAFWFGDVVLYPKRGTTSGYLAGYDAESQSVLTYRQGSDYRPELMANCWVPEQPQTLSLTDDWLVITSNDSIYLYSTSLIMNSMGVNYTTYTPDDFRLHSRPNPFNPNTTISFDLPESSYASLTIYDITGREIRSLVEGEFGPGHYDVSWLGIDDLGRNVSTGVYICRLTTGNQSISTKLLYVQ